MPTCPGCSSPNRDGARFCGGCGQALHPVPTGKAAGMGAPRPPVTGPPGPPPGPPPASGPPASPSSPRRTTLLAIGAAVAVAAGVAAGLVIVGGDDPDGEQVELSSAADDSGDDGDRTEESATDGADPSDDDGSTDAGRARAEVIGDVQVTASATRRAVPQLNCGGSSDFLPEYLFDGDPNTGWGASDGDGAGQSVTVDLGGPVQLTQVGIIPGYVKVAPRQDQGCATVNAFPFNRFIAEVRYDFDDGSSRVQTFEPRGELQRIRVDVTTSTVTMTILRTERHGADDDTIISTMELRGIR